MPRVLVLCGVLFLCPCASASAAKRELPVKRGSTYLALGDSVSFGYQDPKVVPAPDYSRARNFLGWPEHAARALRLKLVNAACPGETSASLVHRDAPNYGCTNLPNSSTGYRDAYPLHAKYSGSQLAFAVKFLRRHRRTRLVTLMIGANDLFRCRSTTSDGCTSAAEQKAVFDGIRSNVRKIVSSVRRKGRYRGRIVLMRYYSPDYNSDFLNGAIRRLNSTAHAAAKPYRVRVADGFGEWRRASVRSGNNPCTAGLLQGLSNGTCDVHPSWAGQGLLAQALIRAVTR